LKISEWKNSFARPRKVEGAGRDGECEWVRREWLRESMRARERRKETNVKGAIRSCEVVSQQEMGI
jgi:hypothetical protein